MALPASGQISMSQVNTELTYSATAQISLNDAAVRSLAGVSSGAISLNELHGKYTPFLTRLTYTADSTLVLPAYVTEIRVKAWGAGGGSCTYTPFGATATGGGGFTGADVTVAGGSSLVIRVGSGGTAGQPATGGGLTGVFIGSATQGNALVVAGSGGGGGAWSNANGGTGGGGTGGQGTNGGYGGTQTAGGAGGSNGGSPGTALTGGAPGGSYSSLAGYGGAGYFGGGGGGSINGGSFYQGGGGGSGWYLPGSVNTSNLNASGSTPPNTGNPDYPGGNKGYGGGGNASGYAGYIVIYY